MSIEVIKPSFEFINAPDYDTLLDTVEQAYRVCYKSESNSDTAESFIKSKLDMGHESPVEHCCITVKITTNRGVTHELVRHRLASYSQESTRYCNYGKDKFGNKVKFIKPSWTSDKVTGVCNL